MTLGYAAAQGYTGTPQRPISPTAGGYGTWFGPLSSSLALAGSAIGAHQSFQVSGSLRSQARQYRARAQQVMEQAYQTGIDLDREGEEFIGTITTQFGKGGTSLSGSPLLVLADTRERIDRNIERVVEQGRIESAALMRMAKKAEKASKSAKLSGLGQTIAAVGTAATLLAGGPFALIGLAGGLGLNVAAARK